jgi:hypothetical protein
MQKSHLRKNAAALGSTACQIVPAASPRGESTENKIAWEYDEHEHFGFAAVGFVRLHFPVFEPSADRMDSGLSEHPRRARGTRL